jgi:hypothetical protein
MIGRQAAQRLARHELANGVYHPHQSFWQWLLSSIEKLLAWLFNTGNHVIPGGWWALVAVAALVVVLAAVTRAPAPPSSPTPPPAPEPPAEPTEPPASGRFVPPA